MKVEIHAFLEDAIGNHHPAYIAVAALVCILSRREGRDISGSVEWLRTFPHGEVKAAIRLIRTLPEIQNKNYPLEDMVRLLRCEVIGKIDKEADHHG